MNPTQRLHILQIRMFRTLMRQSNYLIVSNLGNQNDSSNFFDLGIVRGRYTVHVACYLNSQVRNADKLLEHVLGQHICVSRFLQVLRIHIDVVRSEMHVCG